MLRTTLDIELRFDGIEQVLRTLTNVSNFLDDVFFSDHMHGQLSLFFSMNNVLSKCLGIGNMKYFLFRGTLKWYSNKISVKVMRLKISGNIELWPAKVCNFVREETKYFEIKNFACDDF